MFMSEVEIARAVDRLNQDAPEIAPYAQYLSDWVAVINLNSDGWVYWRAGRSAADKLCNAISKAVEAVSTGGEMPTTNDLENSLLPIASAASRHNLQMPELRPAASRTSATP